VKKEDDMKIFYIECDADELKANRGIMDAIIDVCQGAVNTFWGTTTPAPVEEEESEGEE
jgi:hypothetical protein